MRKTDSTYRNIPMHAGITLKSARQLVESFLTDGYGVLCPLCHQEARVYPRLLNSTMAFALIVLVQLHRASNDWVHVRDVERRMGEAGHTGTHPAGEIGRLKHWKLVEDCSPSSERKSASGLWRPTQLGVDFAEGRALVPARVVLYNNRLVAIDASVVNVREAIGRSYDYEHVWNGQVPPTAAPSARTDTEASYEIVEVVSDDTDVSMEASRVVDLL